MKNRFVCIVVCLFACSFAAFAQTDLFAGAADFERETFSIRVEFQNVFNRLFLAAPSVGGPFGVSPATVPNLNQQGLLTGGYGFVNWVKGGNTTGTPTAGARPRTGQIVARLRF
jgi:hypothetical protein